MRKNEWILISIFIGLFVVIGLYAWFSSQGDNEKTTKEKKTQTNIKEKTTNIDVEKEVADIQQSFYQQNQGQIGKQYGYDDKHYLMITQTSNVAYDDTYAGNKLIWVEKKNGNIHTKELNEGTNLVGVAIENKSPYWEIEGRTFFIYYEHIYYPSSGYSYNGKGYVYEVDGEGNIKKRYETKGSFDSIARNKNGTVVLKERVYKDEKNSYPILFKPYELREIQYQSETWKIVKKEMVNPQIEQMKKEETELEKNRGPKDPYQVSS